MSPRGCLCPIRTAYMLESSTGRLQDCCSTLSFLLGKTPQILERKPQTLPSAKAHWATRPVSPAHGHFRGGRGRAPRRVSYRAREAARARTQPGAPPDQAHKDVTEREALMGEA